MTIGSKVVLAHKRQLKTLPVSRRKTSKLLVFQGEENEDHVYQPQQSISILWSSCDNNSSSSNRQCMRSNSNNVLQGNKRKRDDIEDVDSDSSSDFYGFAADSFIFAGEEGSHAIGDVYERENIGIRKSKRKSKKRKHDDFIYY